MTDEEEHRRLFALLSEIVVGGKHLPAGARVSYAEDLGGSCAALFGRGERMAFEGVELLRRAGKVGITRWFCEAGCGVVG